MIESNIAILHPAELSQSTFERREPSLIFRIVLRVGHQHADAPHRPRLLRARRERPRSGGCRAAKKREELAPSHSITSLASACRVGGTSMPSDLAVLRLITSSNLVGRMIGKSPGFSPLRIRPA